MSVGHSKAPVHSWLKPRSTLTLRAITGWRDCPCETIQSNMAPFRPLVSSDLAPEIPFCSCFTKPWSAVVAICKLWRRWYQLGDMHGFKFPTVQNLLFQSWDHLQKSIEHRMPLPLSTTSLRNCATCLIKRSETYWAVNDSSGSSASSPRRKRLFVNIACTLHNACTVRPKCRPCKMRGSEWHLWGQSKSLISAELYHCDMKDGNHAFFRGPRVRTSSHKQTVLVSLVPFSPFIVEVEAI